MNINGIDLQAIWNWALGGGFTLATAATVVKTVSQKRLNAKFNKLSDSIDLAALSAKGIEDAKKMAVESYANAERLVANSQEKIMIRMDGVDGKITNLTDNVLKDDILLKLDSKLKSFEEYQKTIDLKDKTIEKYASDMKQIKIELERLKHKEV